MNFFRSKPKIKILFLLTILLVAGFIFENISYAKYEPQDPNSYKQDLEADGINLPQWSLYTTKYVTDGLNRLMIGVPILEGEEQVNRGGAVGITASMIDGLYENKPVSSKQYFAYVARNLNFTKPVYAQGQGWQFLQPVLGLWKAVRNICYLFFVIIFVAIGFMIMFRQKMDSQTIVSVQTALPKIIASLLLVTFSYAICGLIVDLIYLGNDLMGAIFSVPLHVANPEFIWNADLNILTFLKIFGGELVQGTGLAVVANMIKSLWDSISGFFSRGDFSSVFFLVIAFSLLSSVIKIFFALLSRYVMLLLYTIVSPFLFLWGSLPGQQDHTSKFFKTMIGNAIVFPAILLMLHLAGYFVVVGGSLPLQPIVPFQIPSANFGTAIGGFIALGILMAASKIPESIDDLLGVRAGVGPALGAEAAGALRRIPIIGGLIG